MTKPAAPAFFRLLLPLLVSIVLLSTAPVAHTAEPPEAAATVSALIKKVMAAYGGEATLKKVATVYTKGSIKTAMREDSGTSTRYFKRPRKLRAELAYQKSSETRVLSGFRGWRGRSDQALREVHGPPYLAMAYQAKYLDLPFGFLDKNYTTTFAGSEKVNAVDAVVLRLEDNEGTVMRVCIDPAGLIIKVIGSFTNGREGTDLSAEFNDFKEVEGIKFPHRITNYSGSNKLAETELTEIKLNQDMPDQLFQP